MQSVPAAEHMWESEQEKTFQKFADKYIVVRGRFLVNFFKAIHKYNQRPDYIDKCLRKDQTTTQFVVNINISAFTN